MQSIDLSLDSTVDFSSATSYVGDPPYYIYWHENWWTPHVCPTTRAIPNTFFQEDMARKAYELTKDLKKRGFVELKTVKQFCELMDFLVEKL